MYKVLKKYSKKDEQKHEITRDPPPQAPMNGAAGQHREVVKSEDTFRQGNGTVVPAYERGGSMTQMQQTGRGGFSESSSYESHEHFERKLRAKRARGDRSGSRKSTERTSEKRQFKEITNVGLGTGDRYTGTGVSTKDSDRDESKYGTGDRDKYGHKIDYDDLMRRLDREIGLINEKLDRILNRIEDVENRADTLSPRELTQIYDGIIYDLDALEAPIDSLFGDVETLKNARHPRANDYYRQVFGLHQRRIAYLERCGVILGSDGKFTRKNIGVSEEYFHTRESLFRSLEEYIEWVKRKLNELTDMTFVDDLKILEEMLEKHRYDHRDIMDFRHKVDQCIAYQSKISAEDSDAYVERLRTLEDAYAQLREVSTGRTLDLDSLIAFIRAAQMELLWIAEREELEVRRNWSDIGLLDLPMLQNYYKQLMHEIELREEQFNAVHNQGAALINQGHPAIEVIEAYVATMRSQWDWLLALTQCLEVHLQDAVNLQQFAEDSQNCEQWIDKQMHLLNTHYDRTDFSLDDGERLLRELDDIRVMLDRYQDVLLSLIERSRIISPLWQRGERIARPLPVSALCNYEEKNMTIRKRDECILADNSDMIKWLVRTPQGAEDVVPSVVFRLPPPDEQLVSFLQRLQAQYERLRRLWVEKQLMVRFYTLLNTMRTLRSWDLKTFMSMDPDHRDAIIKAINDDANKLLSELDPNDPLALRLREELRLTNEHFYNLLRASQRGVQPEISDKFDEKLNALLQKLEEAWQTLNKTVVAPLPKDIAGWEKLIFEHKHFEDALQSLDSEVSALREMFRQLEDPTPMQRSRMDQLLGRWEDLWELSRMYADRLKAFELVLNGLTEATQIVSQHEITLGSFDPLPSKLEELRAVHSQLLELQLVLQQQQPIMDDLAANVGRLRQHVARTRFDVLDHPDVNRLEDEVQNVTVRWENICAQVMERLKAAELALQSLMIYRASYITECAWLDRVEGTIRRLRKPEDLRPHEYQDQLDILLAEYAQLTERTQAMEYVNLYGGKFIRDARIYDIRLVQYRDILEEVNRGIDSLLRRTQPPPTPGADQVAKELDELNKRFAQLSSFIYQRQNELQLLMQRWRQEQTRPKTPPPRPRTPSPPPRRRSPSPPPRRRTPTPPPRRRTPTPPPRPKSPVTPPLKKPDWGHEEYENGFVDDWTPTHPETTVPKVSEHEEDVVMYAEETEERKKFYEMEGVKHMQTGEILTFVEAIREGLLDLSSGEFLDVISGSKISLEEAVTRGHISQTFNDCLNSRYGIRDPSTGEDLTLVEAIQRGLYDPECRQLRDPNRGELMPLYEATRVGVLSMESVPRLIKSGILKMPPMHLEQAIEQKVLDLETGQFVGRVSGETLPLRDALRNGYISISSSLTPMIALSLTDCIEQRFINPTTGEFVDKNTNEKFTLRDAVSKANNLINLNVREVVNTNERKRITVGDAVLRNIVNTRQGTFTDTTQRQTLSLAEANQREFIQKPLTLKDVAVRDLTDSTGRFIDGGTKRRLTLLEAVAEGLIDPDVPHIVDPEDEEVISITDALEREILTPQGGFVKPETGERYSIQEAHRRGLLTEPVRFTVFDVKGVRNTKANRTISFNEAVETGVIQLSSERFVDSLMNESYLLPDTVERARLVDATLHTILSATPGIRDRQGSEISIFKAICDGLIDTKKGGVVDRQRGQLIKPKEAYERGLISLKAAVMLTALFDVHPSLVEVSKKWKPRRKRQEPKKESTYKSTTTATKGDIKTTLADALRQGLVDTHTQKYRKGDREISLQEALNEGLVDTSAEWVVPAKHGPATGPTVQESITEEMSETSQVKEPKFHSAGHTQETMTTVKRLRTKETVATGGPGGVAVYRAITSGKNALDVPVDGLHVHTAERNGLFDLDTGLLSVPDTGRTLTMEEALDLGILNWQQFTVRDPKTRERLSFREALDKGIIDSTGHIRDGGKSWTLRDAIHKEYVVLAPEPSQSQVAVAMKTIQFGQTPGVGPVMSITPIGTSNTEESEASFSFDAKRGEIMDSNSRRPMSLDEAVQTGKLSRNMLRVKDALSDREMSFADAIAWGIIDPQRDQYVDKKEGVKRSLREAAVLGYVFVEGGGGDAVRTDIRQQMRKTVTTKEAAVLGPAAFVDYSLQKLIDFGWYDQQSGMFTHPDTGKQLSLKEAIMKGLFNPYESVVVDPQTNKQVSLLDAIQSGLVDATNGFMMDGKSGQKMDLKTAYERGFIRSGVVPQSMDLLVSHGRLDLATGHVQHTDDSASLPLHEAISRGIVDPTSMVVRDPSTGHDIPFLDAVNAKVVDLSRGLVINRQTGEGVSLTHAIASGIIQSTSGGRRSMDIAPVIGPPRPTGPRGGVSPASREQLVDLGGNKQVMVKVIKDDQGIEKGEYMDSATGMKFTVRLHGDPYVTQTKTTVKSTAQVQSVELEPQAELIGIDKVRDNKTGRVMTLSEAQRLGLAKVDKHGKQLTKTYSDFRSDLAHALNKGVVDPGRNEHVSLADAIKSRLIDIRDLVFIHPQTDERIDFVQAANMGLMDVTLAEILPKGVCNPANGERISVQRAIEMRIIDPRTGTVSNPFKNEPLTWLDILKPVYASLTMEGVYDPRKGYAVPVTHAINDGLIDVRKREYNNPITNERYQLEEASKVGLIDEATYRIITSRIIDDWRAGKRIDLLEAVQNGLVDPHRRTVQLEKGAVVPISKAVEEGRFPKDLGEKMRRVDKLTFAEAYGRGLIDIRSHEFTDPDSARRMPVTQAVQEGYIDTGNVESREGADDRNLSIVIDSYEFDENSGRIREHKSGLYVTFREAIDRGIIDGDSLICDVDQGRTMTLRAAVNTSLINSDGKFVDRKTGAKVNLKDAVRVGLIALIPSPMLASEAFAEAAKRREKEGFKFKIERAGSPTLSSPGGRQTVHEESTTIRVTPRYAEPTLSLRVRTDDISDRLRSLINDPQTYADRLHDFFQRLQEKNFDLDEKAIENPATGGRISIREAVESGLLDIMSGEVVHPSSGRRYSVPKAVHLKMMQANAAKSVMEALNLSQEELYTVMQGISPRSDFSPIGFAEAANSPGATTYVKEVSWRGHPSELRGSKGDLSQYTTISGERTYESIPPVSSGTYRHSDHFDSRDVPGRSDDDTVVRRRVEETTIRRAYD